MLGSDSFNERLRQTRNAIREEKTDPVEVFIICIVFFVTLMMYLLGLEGGDGLS